MGNHFLGEGNFAEIVKICCVAWIQPSFLDGLPSNLIEQFSLVKMSDEVDFFRKHHRQWNHFFRKGSSQKN